MISLKNNSKFSIFILIITLIIISFFLLPRLTGGVRFEEILSFIVASMGIYIFLKYQLQHKIILINIYMFFLISSFFLSLYSDVLYVNLNYINWIYFFKYLTYFSFLIIGFFSGKQKILENIFVINVLFLCIFINFFWMLLQSLTGNYRVLFGSNEATSYGIRMLGEGAAFQVGSIISFIIFVLFITLFKVKKTIIKFILSFVLIVFFYFLFLTESRVSLIGAVLGVLVILYVRLKLIFKLISIGFVFLLVNIILIIGGFSFNTDNNRFTISGLLDSYNVRGQEIWSEPLLIINDNILSFQGLGALSHYNSNTNEMHNYYLKILFEGGIGYLFLFLFFILFIFYLKSKSSKYYDYFLLLKVYVLLLAISAFFQDSFSSNKAVIPMFFLLGYCLACNIFLMRNRDE